MEAWRPSSTGAFAGKAVPVEEGRAFSIIVVPSRRPGPVVFFGRTRSSAALAFLLASIASLSFFRVIALFSKDHKSARFFTRLLVRLSVRESADGTSPFFKEDRS